MIILIQLWIYSKLSNRCLQSNKLIISLMHIYSIFIYNIIYVVHLSECNVIIRLIRIFYCSLDIIILYYSFNVWILLSYGNSYVLLQFYKNAYIPPYFYVLLKSYGSKYYAYIALLITLCTKLINKLFLATKSVSQFTYTSTTLLRHWVTIAPITPYLVYLFNLF